MNWINVGSNFEISIKELAQKISKILNYEGEILWDSDKPDGTHRKKLDSTCIKKLGWEAKTDLDHGIRSTIYSYRKELLNQNET